MRKSFKVCLLVGFTAALSVSTAEAKAKYDPPFTLNERYSQPILCREFEKLLRHPINKPYTYDLTTSDLVIPPGKAFAKFTLPPWEPSNLEEFKKFLSEDTLKRRRRVYQSASGKSFDDEVSKVRKATYDFYKTGGQETVMQYTQKDNENQWHLYVEERSADKKVYDSHSAIIIADGVSYVVANTAYSGDGVIFIKEAMAFPWKPRKYATITTCVFEYSRSFITNYVTRGQSKKKEK